MKKRLLILLITGLSFTLILFIIITVNVITSKHAVSGPTTLTPQQIQGLDGDPVKLQKNVKTVSDVILYFKTSNFQLEDGDIKLLDGIYLWHFNRPALNAMQNNMAVCGGISSIVNYLLKGDYDEVGFMDCTRYGSGHVFNYVEYKNRYFIVDFTSCIVSAYRRSPIVSKGLSSLKECAMYYMRHYDPEGNIKLFVSYESANCLPVANLSNTNIMNYYPKDSSINVLFNSQDPDFRIKFIDIPSKTPLWK